MPDEPLIPFKVELALVLVALVIFLGSVWWLKHVRSEEPAEYIYTWQTVSVEYERGQEMAVIEVEPIEPIPVVTCQGEGALGCMRDYVIEAQPKTTPILYCTKLQSTASGAFTCDHRVTR